MKYRVIRFNEDELDVIVEDGGVASIYYNGNNYITNYYGTRLTEIDPNPEDIWEQMSEGKVWCKDWEGTPTEEEFVKDALAWLVFTPDGEEMSWTLDENLFSEFF